ncbi:MAG: ribosomal-protein-alanine N-acetyltransferase [Gallionellales bacterium RBG_16_56_9]|nr:MAG: ribosomal-protein-alanine N-acetyltransferase [Gallionellales bacterium RBG_16_56_9]
MSVLGQPSDASPSQALQFGPMRAVDLEQVLDIENDVYSHPWTRGNFLDALASGYRCCVVRVGQDLIGYFLLMLAVDEAHLLNISVRRDWQGRGVGRLMLNHVAALARKEGMSSILLEVRPSNPRAARIYRRYGFIQIGLRKNYYPAADNGREDAIVMRLVL